MKNLIESLKKLVASYAMSGYEWELNVTAVIQQLVGFSGKKVGTNIVYSLGEGKKIIFISAHMDEVGFFVTNSNKSFCKIIPIGSVNIKSIIGEKLVFFNRGILYSSKKILKKKSFSDLQVKTTEQIPIGSVGTFEKKFVFKNNKITSPSLDNKVGCLVLIELIRIFSRMKNKQFRYVFCFASREEGSGNGLMSAVRYFNPHLCIDIDSAYAKPFIGNKYANWTIPVIGKGPAIQLQGKGFRVSSEVLRFVENITQKNNIPYQYEIPSNQEGGTNSGAILNAGYEIMQINIPVANQHSAKSKVSIIDIQNTIMLLKQVLSNL